MTRASGPPSPWSDLDRPPLSGVALNRALVDFGGWRRVDVVASTGSTNADVASAARAGEAAGLVLIAEAQDSGRGRLDRRWEAPPRSSVLLSALLRPTAPPSTWPLLPFVAGLAVVEAVRAVSGVTADLKWPNDVMHDGRKLGGILVEVTDGAVVVGIGVNVSLRPDELPTDVATSIAVAGGKTDREALTKEILRALRRRYDTWSSARGAPDAVLPAYREVCRTIGREVRITMPTGVAVTGTAAEVDDGGRLVIVAPDGTRTSLSVGDVVHVRPGG
jgi:BirA family biotin operon repressor/biotin-[acetyl-CoA-carboxylase] ligase